MYYLTALNLNLNLILSFHMELFAGPHACKSMLCYGMEVQSYGVAVACSSLTLPQAHIDNLMRQNEHTHIHIHIHIHIHKIQNTKHKTCEDPKSYRIWLHMTWLPCDRWCVRQ